MCQSRAIYMFEKPKRRRKETQVAAEKLKAIKYHHQPYKFTQIRRRSNRRDKLINQSLDQPRIRICKNQFFIDQT